MDNIHGFCAACVERKTITCPLQVEPAAIIVDWAPGNNIVGCKLQPSIIVDWALTCPLQVEPDPESLTCFECPDRDVCDLVDDPYNTDGDCIMSK